MEQGQLHIPGTEAISGRAELLSKRAIKRSLVGRRVELAAALAHLAPEERLPAGRALVIAGDSGVGKSYFTRALLQVAFRANPAALFLYIDVANDEYQSARVISSVLKMTLIPGAMAGPSVVSVPAELTLERFRRHTRQRGVGRGLLRSLAQAIGTALGLGPAVGAALNGQADTDAAVEDELAAYLAWVAKKQAVFLVIDNVQFLNLDTRLTIESVIQRVDLNAWLVVVDRTIDGQSTLFQPIRCFSDHLDQITLVPLTREETEELVLSAIESDSAGAQRLAHDIFSKTGGNGKDIEYCLRQYTLELGRGAQAGAIEGLLSTIDRLPLIQRQFLMIAALLDGGVDKAIARSAVRSLTSAYDESALDGAVEELIDREYLRLTGESGQRLRAGHERIIMAIRNLADDETQEDVRRSLVSEIEQALEGPDRDAHETYLLHCFVGLQTARELTHHVHYISRLIQSQHRQEQFSYLVALADELQDVLPLLPEHALSDLLDAMQKSSAFERGLQVLHLLDSKGARSSGARSIDRFKFLTQAYRYDEALTLADTLPQNDWAVLYKVNALLALDRDEEARGLTAPLLHDPLTEARAVLLRNTITLFNSSQALEHLDRAYQFFEKQQSDFRLATIDTNRSLVFLRLARTGDALRCLERSSERMRRVGSRELYQAQLNLALRAAVLGDYEESLAFLKQAGSLVPHALLLDQVKITMDRVVVRHLAGQIDRRETVPLLQECLDRIRGVRMPYMTRALESNISVGLGTSAGSVAHDPDVVSVVLPIGDPQHDDRPVWTLLMSIHWRY